MSEKTAQKTAEKIAERKVNVAKDMAKIVGTQADRKLKAHRHPTKGVWFGLGMMGLVGWSVVVPTLIGAALGIWLDANHRVRFSWTLSLLVVGLLVGCLNAWHWVSNEDQTMREDDRDV